MKRVIRDDVKIVKYEWDIDIVAPSYQNIFSATEMPDLTGTEYSSFIDDLISQFDAAGFGLRMESDYTHDSNFGSMSEYFTFTRWVDKVCVIVVVNVRISDHPDVPRKNLTPDQKRAKYGQRIGNEIAQKEGASSSVTYTMDITFDDKHFKSFFSALMYANSRLRGSEEDVKDIEDSVQ